MTKFTANTADIKNILSEIQDAVIGELNLAYPGYIKPDEHILSDALAHICLNTHDRVVFIVEEWDVIFRVAQDA